jgi:hypothetical protein
MLGVGTQFFKLFSLPNLEDKKYEQESESSDNLSWAFQCICMTGGVDWACKKKKKTEMTVRADCTMCREKK